METGLDYRGARFYDSDVARFLSLDPLAAQFPEWSDYNYVLGNPVMLVDPDGKAPTTDFYNISGEKIASDGINNGQKRLVLHKKLEEKLKKAKSGKITMNFENETVSIGRKVSNKIIVVPTNNEIEAIDKLYSETFSTGVEHGFVSDGENVSLTKGESGMKWNGNSAVSEQIDKGGKIKLMVHSHPFSVNYKTNKFTGLAWASGDDITVHKALEKRSKGEGDYSKYFDVKYSGIAGFKISGNKNGNVEFEPSLNFFDSDSSRGNILYTKEFKNVVKKINKE